MTARRRRLRRLAVLLLWKCLVGSGSARAATTPPRRRAAATAKGPCEDQPDEGRCGMNAQGTTDVRCLWVGASCITLPAPPRPPAPPPTSPPSIPPSDAPSGGPSRRPTDGPTDGPTPGPTEEPAEAPADEGNGASPAKSPSLDSSADRSASPSGSPVNSPTTREVSSTMTLRGAGELGRDAMEAWMEETQERIRDEAEEIGNGPFATVVFDGQSAFDERRALKRRDAFAPASAGRERAIQLRHLGKEPSPSLQIDFTTIIESVTETNDWDPNEIVAAGFKTPSQQKEYIYSLKAADSASFESVHGMTMEVEGLLITETNPAPNPSRPPQQPETVQSNRAVPVVAGSVAGGVLLLLVTAAVGAMYYRRNASSPSPAPGKRPPGDSLPGTFGGDRADPPPRGVPARSRATEVTTATMTTTTPTAASPESGTFEIVEPAGGAEDDDVSALADPSVVFEVVDPGRGARDDVSALADPSLGYDRFGDRAERARPGDATAAGATAPSSGGLLYEYGVASRGGRLRADAATAATEGGGTLSCAEDGTLEARYRDHGGPGGPRGGGGGGRPDARGRTAVVAPAGELGIVLVDAAGNAPAVHAIRETSVLRGRVGVGDILVSVDEVDCRGLSAKQVTRFIGGRRGNPARTLVLLRGV